jgi:hypothetical protein
VEHCAWDENVEGDGGIDMLSNAADVEIKTRYEDLEMSVADIAEDMRLDADAVRMSLAQTSATYRVELRQGKVEEKAFFENAVAKRAAETMEQLLDSPEESVKFRAAKFIMDEYKGRNDAAVKGLRSMQNLGIGVLQLNEALRRSREQLAKARGNNGVIDIGSGVKKVEGSVTSASESVNVGNEQMEMVLAK